MAFFSFSSMSMLRKISGFHGGQYFEDGFMGYDKGRVDIGIYKDPFP
jgi:hypothetical protein